MVKYRYLDLVICFALSLFSLVGCGQSFEKSAKADSLDRGPDQTVSGNFSSQSALVLDSIELTKFFAEYPNLKEVENDVRIFYRERSFTYAWFENELLIEQAGNLSNRILNLENDGIYRKLYYQRQLDSLIHGTNAGTKSAKPDVTLEILLTAEYFVYSKLVWEGMSKEVSKSSKWYLPRKTVNYNTYLDSLLKSPAQNELIKEPVYRQYELLRGFLRKYRELDSADKWESLVSGSLPNKGDSSIFTKQVKKRLFELGDFDGDTTIKAFDTSLGDALVIFQQRHGLAADGKLDKETLAAIG